MFQLKKDNCVWWPVTITQPEDNGLVSEHTCQFRFEIVPQDEFDMLAGGGDAHLVTQVVKGWKELSDEEGKDLPYTDENIKSLFAIPFIRTSVLRAYMQACTGAPAKN